MASPANRPPADPVHQLFELSIDMLGVMSADGHLTQLNPAWERKLGWTCAELKASPFVSFVHPDDVEGTLEQFAALTRGGDQAVVAFENRYRTRDADYLWFESTAVARGGVVYLVTHEITDSKAAEAERERSASLAMAIADSVLDGVYVVDTGGMLTFINPAGLRLLGYESDQELLGAGPHAVFHHTRADGTPYPMEECPLLDVLADGRPRHCEEDTFWRADGTALPVSYSAAPITLADGIGSVVAFRDVSFQLVERHRLEALGRHVAWLDEIRKALDDRRFVLYGQPIVALASGQIVRHELLLRMISQTGEIVGPGDFLPAAEKYGLIGEIDRWVISEAVAVAAAGRTVALNLSAGSMSQAGILLHIERELGSSGAAAGNLTFEVTETTLMLDVEAGRRFANRLVALGCSLTLDDFGTGYGSLTYLREFPISDVKIDVQFVREMAGSDADQRLVQSIVQMARSLGKTTTAEGVEDEQTLALLRTYGVDYAQGYHLGRPAPMGATHAAAGRRFEAAVVPTAVPHDIPAVAPELAKPVSRDESARLRDVEASSRDVAADARDRVAGRKQTESLAADETAHRARMAASLEARNEAAADRASAASDRQGAMADRGSAAAGDSTTEARLATLAAERAEAARLRDASARSRDVAANKRDREAGRDERDLAASDASTADARIAANELVREDAAADRASSAVDRQSAAADRDRSAAASRQARTDLDHARGRKPSKKKNKNKR